MYYPAVARIKRGEILSWQKFQTKYLVHISMKFYSTCPYIFPFWSMDRGDYFLKLHKIIKRGTIKNLQNQQIKVVLMSKNLRTSEEEIKQRQNS